MRVEKPWGAEIHLGIFDGKAYKLLIINEGQQTSKHYHQKKRETFIVLDGTLDAEIDGTVFRFVPHQYVVVEPNIIHQKRAVHKNCRILEISSQLTGDVYRVEDPYGRGDEP